MGKPTYPDYLELSRWAARFMRVALGLKLDNWNDRYHETEYIGFVKRTRGTETSQYLEEKTSTEIPLVVASERGPGQCLLFN